MAESEWQIDVDRQRARHSSGLVLEVVENQGENYSVQALAWSMPQIQGMLDPAQKRVLDDLISERVLEGGTLLVKAIVKEASEGDQGGKNNQAGQRR